MGPEQITNLLLNSSSDSTNLSVPKLHDDRSNWSDYQLRIKRAMGSKGLWRHVLGNAIAPKPYMLLNGAFVLSDEKTEATEEQVESKETKIVDFEKKEYIAQYILLSMTSTRLGSKIKELKSLKEMWDIIVADVMKKSTLYLLDAEEQLTSMKLVDNEDLKIHLAEMKQHFQLMIQHCKNLIKTGSLLLDIWFNTLIMSSLPSSYRPTLQTITAAEKASALTGSSHHKMKADDLIAFLIEEAQHHIINDERAKNSEVALMALGKKAGKKPRQGKGGKNKAYLDIICHNCKNLGHKKADCWSKGGGKEGQGPS